MIEALVDIIGTFIEIAPAGIMQSLVLSLLVIGVMIPFKLLDFPDLTAEGSYPLGAASCAFLIVLGMPSIPAIILASCLAGALGIGTAFVHLRYKVNTLLAGIILSTMVYSLNLRLMGGPNIALFEYKMLFEGMSTISKIGLLCGINLLIITALILFLKTEKGLEFRATGINKSFAQKQGINTKKQIYFGLFIANFLCGLSGALIIQLQNYADIGIGAGIAIYALASLMIGIKIIGETSVLLLILSPFIGAIMYSQIQGVALSAGLAPTDLKLLTGFIVLGTIAMGRKETH